jgi:alpha-1,3-mannosyl-glycoprotein beta-1,2-N-acetylglucosaminyltransferase
VKYHPVGQLPILFSQDGENQKVTNIIKGTILHLKHLSPEVSFTHRQHISHEFYTNGYFALAAHYKFALDEAFSNPAIKRVIILEEDLLIAPDFFDYFAATKPLLDEDQNLLGVSAWNDNGMKESVRDSKQLYRSDFFPGLGWMMPRRIWEELGPIWPKAYWDDWLREPKQRKNRQFIRPEVCRTFHIGQHGVSNSQYSNYLNSILLNTEAVSFTQMDLSYLQLDRWDKEYLEQVRRAKEVSLDDARSGRAVLEAKKNGWEIRLRYDRFEGPGSSYSNVAAWSGAMDNVKAGVPRTAYKGIVSVWKGDVKVHLIPRDFS